MCRVLWFYLSSLLNVCTYVKSNGFRCLHTETIAEWVSVCILTAGYVFSTCINQRYSFHHIEWNDYLKNNNSPFLIFTAPAMMGRCTFMLFKKKILFHGILFFSKPASPGADKNHYQHLQVGENDKNLKPRNFKLLTIWIEGRFLTDYATGKCKIMDILMSWW